MPQVITVRGMMDTSHPKSGLSRELAEIADSKDFCGKRLRVRIGVPASTLCKR